MSPARERLLEQIARQVAATRPHGIAPIAIDGVDGAGKTCFADDLAGAREPHGRQVIRASVDDFHHPAAERHARGRDSPEGFFHDSYDYATLRERLLDPLATGGSRRFRWRAFHWRSDQAVDAPEESAAHDAILLLDGIFLHRDDLVAHWDLSIFLRVSPETSLARNTARGGRPSVRYTEGQRLYFEACDPEHRATIIVDNDDLAAPRVISASPERV